MTVPDDIPPPGQADQPGWPGLPPSGQPLPSGPAAQVYAVPAQQYGFGSGPPSYGPPPPLSPPPPPLSAARPRRRRSRFLAAAVVLLVLAGAAGGLLAWRPWITHRHFALPAAIAGQPRSAIPAATTQEGGLVAALDGKLAHRAAAFYGSAGETAFVVAGGDGAAGLAKDEGTLQRNLADSANESTSVGSWQDFSPGPLGGTLACAAVASAGTEYAMCLFYDADVFGVVLDFRDTSPVVAAGTTRAVRAATEH